jgi:general secretion pathway protein L
VIRIRARREAAEFDWAVLDARGALLKRGDSALEPPPARGACELVLPAELVTLARVPVPAAQRRRLGSALHYLVEDLVLSEPERVHVAQAAASPPGHLCLGIVDRAWLQAVLARLARSGLVPQRALAETLLPPLQPGAWTVVLDGDGSFVRTGASEGFALDRNEPPASLLLALQASAPSKIVMHGARPAWAWGLGVPVESAPAWDWIEPIEDIPLDLLEGSQKNHSGRWKRTAALAAALAIIGVAGLGLQWAAERHERKSLAAQMSALYRETFGPQAVLLDPPLQMGRALTALRQQHGKPNPSDFLALLEKIPPQEKNIESLSYATGRLIVALRGGGKLDIAAEAPPRSGPATLPELRARLADMRLMQQEIESLRRTRVALAPDPRALTQAMGRRSAADVDFGEWLDWVRGMQRDFGVRVESTEIRALGPPGRVRVEASFSR